VATLQIVSAPVGASKTEVVLSSSADTATLATALSTKGVMLVWDPAKVTDEYTLDKLVELIEQKIAEASTSPPS
jgi:non-homologous end joining protein Ku